MAEARIDVVIGSAQAQSGANALNRAVDGIRGNFLDLAAKVFVAERAIERVWGLAIKGAQFEETMSRLNRQMGHFNSNAHLMVGELQSISRGTLAVEQSATLASRALAIGLNPDQIRTFTQAADLLKDQMGTELPEAFDHLTQAAITGRGAVLAQLGIYVDLDEEVKRLAVSTNRTTDQITKQEKAMLMTKAMAGQVREAHGKLSDGMVSDAVRLKQVERQFDDLTTAINIRFKTSVIDSLDWWEKLKTSLEQFKPSNMAAGYIRSQGLDIGQPDHPITQEVFGRAIVQDTLGNLARQRDSFTNAIGSTPIPQLPTSLRGNQLDAERERRDKGLQGHLERTKAGLDAAGRLFELDAQRQLITQEDLVSAKGAFQLRELASIGETLSRQKEMEEQFHTRRLQIGFESTEERISEEERYRSKVFDINHALTANAHAFGIAATQSAEENAMARAATEQRLGQRLVDSFKSTFEIQESLRRQDLEDAQTYYQGEFDMAVARFAGDEEIAAKERDLLREQLAFKLRLTQEEVDRMLFLRKAGDFEGVRQIAGRADPALGSRAVEGIVESATAKDILAAERANGDFFAGWSRGLQKYAQDRDSAFGMSADMARRAAQGMEQGFQKFFFDGMEGKFTSFKDVLSGVLDFTKQIVSQMAAQMMIVGLIKPGANALMNIFGGGGAAAASMGASDFSRTNFFAKRNGGIMPVEHYADGGITSRAQLALFGEGSQPEAFVPLPDGRTIPVTMKFRDAMPPAGSGGGPVVITMPVTILNQHDGAKVEARQSTGANGLPQLEVLVTKVVNHAIGEGRFDRAMQRYGSTPQPIGR